MCERFGLHSSGLPRLEPAVKGLLGELVLPAISGYSEGFLSAIGCRAGLAVTDGIEHFEESRGGWPSFVLRNRSDSGWRLTLAVLLNRWLRPAGQILPSARALHGDRLPAWYGSLERDPKCSARRRRVFYSGRTTAAYETWIGSREELADARRRVGTTLEADWIGDPRRTSVRSVIVAGF